jgi:hypothetical protein
MGMWINVDEIWWSSVHMCQSTDIMLSVQWVYGSLVGHGHGPSHSSRPLDCGWWVAFIIFMRTHPTTYHPESGG